LLLLSISLLSRSIRFLLALVVPSLSAGVHAGPTLDGLIGHARSADAAAVDTGKLADDGPGLAPLLPPTGFALAWGEPQGPDLPGLVANAFGGRGGLLLQLDAFERGRPWHARAGVLLQGEGASRRVTFDGTGLSFDLFGEPGAGELYASVERRHWGPGWVGSLILDGSAPAVPAVGWRRTAVRGSATPWLSWIGPWGADFFVGRLTGHVQPKRPTLVGMRVQLQPVDGLDIGLSRTMQWGGRGRDESALSFWHSLIGNDNVGFEGITYDNEPGNQLAGIDVRWRIHRPSATSVYGQMIGEDEAGKFPSRNMFLLGFDTRVPTPRGSVRMFVEWSDTLAGRGTNDPRPGASYRHTVYRQGYTHEGALLATPAGGDVMLTSVGWVVRDGPLEGTLVATAGRAETTAPTLGPGRVRGVNTAWRIALRGHEREHVGARWSWWSDFDGSRKRHALQLWWQTALP
jgi:hypothetical protein